ncbi:MAG: hypothetical protein ACTSVU_06650 [Promethearchaeota archaeon]
MPNETFPLTHRLIEGFLYTYMEDWKKFSEIQQEVLKHFGEEICRPSEIGKTDEPRYILRLRKTLERGVKNGIYIINSQDETYKIVN